VKVVVVILAIVIGLGVLIAVGALIFGIKVMRATRVEQGPEGTRVTTPFGSVVSSDDPVEIARSLQVEVYPGATPLSGGAAVNVGGFKVVNARFETEDPPEKVAEFYRTHYPRANVSVQERNEHTLVVDTGKGVISVNIQRRGDGSRIEIANVGGGRPDAEPDREAEDE
jgi:hypothetical protein